MLHTVVWVLLAIRFVTLVYSVTASLQDIVCLAKYGSSLYYVSRQSTRNNIEFRNWIRLVGIAWPIVRDVSKAAAEVMEYRYNYRNRPTLGHLTRKNLSPIWPYNVFGETLTSLSLTQSIVTMHNVQRLWALCMAWGAWQGPRRPTFLPRCMECRCGLAMSAYQSVRLTNAPIVTKRKKNVSRFFIPYERSFSLVFWEKEWLVGGDLFYLKFWVNRPPLEQNRRFWQDNRSYSASTVLAKKFK